MRLLYEISIHLFNAAVALAALFGNGKARLMIRGRRGVVARALAENEDDARTTVWVHCASLGEFEQGRPLIEKIKERSPDVKIVLTFFSPSGYEVRKNFPKADYIYYLPSDTARNARRFVKAIKPDVAIFVKYEYWYNYLRELRGAEAKSYVVSAIFREGIYFFKPYGGFFRGMLRLIDWFFVQNQESQRLLSSIGIVDNVTITGDTRFDRVADIVAKAPQLPIVERFAAGSKVVVCGSTWMADFHLLLPLMQNHPDIKFIIAPHQIDESEIEKMIKMSGRETTRYTQRSNPEATLMIIDCIGILSGVYAYGDIAYIGGGFGVGIHNILEAATWGKPVIFGPNYRKFREAVDLVTLGGAFSVADFSQLNQTFAHILDNQVQISQISKAYVEQNIGATKHILEKIL